MGKVKKYCPGTFCRITGSEKKHSPETPHTLAAPLRVDGINVYTLITGPCDVLLVGVVHYKENCFYKKLFLK